MGLRLLLGLLVVAFVEVAALPEGGLGVVGAAAHEERTGAEEQRARASALEDEAAAAPPPPEGAFAKCRRDLREHFNTTALTCDHLVWLFRRGICRSPKRPAARDGCCDEGRRAYERLGCARAAVSGSAGVGGLTASDLIGVVVVVVVASLARAASAAWRLDAVFPDVAWVILSGAALGLALRAYRGVGGGDFASIRFSDDVFLFVMLPPILLDATLEVDKRALRRHAARVVAFAVLGTALSTVATALAVAGATGWSAAEALTFGSLIAPTDPCAILAILKDRLRVSPKSSLYMGQKDTSTGDAASICSPGEKGVVQKTLARCSAWDSFMVWSHL